MLLSEVPLLQSKKLLLRDGIVLAGQKLSQIVVIETKLHLDLFSREELVFRVFTLRPCSHGFFVLVVHLASKKNFKNDKVHCLGPIPIRVTTCMITLN